MKRGLLAVLLAGLVLATTTCGGGEPEQEGLAAQLPALMLTTDEVADQINDFPGGGVWMSDARFRSNEDLADELPGDLLNVGDTTEELNQAGRVEGYLAHYEVGPRDEPLDVVATVRVALDLYREESSAQRALQRRPLSTSGDAFPAPAVGDASVVWPHAAGNGNPECPCHFHFRVGRLVAAVSTSYHVPQAFGRRPDPIQVALAQTMARRMRDALAAESRAGKRAALTATP